MKRHFHSLTFQILIAAVVTGTVLAQGGTGRSETVPPIRTDDVDSRSSSKRVFRRTARSFVPPAPKVLVPETGRIAIVINEGNSFVELARLDGTALSERIPVSAKASSLILRNLVVGSYSLRASKDGYHDEVRTVEIAKGKRRRVEINLRPKMAVLSVSASVEDAIININKIGEFNKPVSDLFVKPGVYQVHVKRRGYKPRDVSVELKSPGSEEYLKIILEPLGIDEMLDLARENIEKGDPAEAEELVKDVLLLNTAHARANLIYGMIGYQRGDQAAVPYLEKATRNGETVSWPVFVLYETLSKPLVEAVLIVDRDGVSVKSRERADLNFTISKADINQITRGQDSAPMIFLDGKSDFHGRAIEPRLKIVSARTSLKDLATCSESPTGRTCASDIDIIFQFLAAWRSDAIPKS